MNPAAVILYGPPASGKDTVTAALTRLDARYAPFERLKIGTGNTEGYRLATPAQLAQLRSTGQVLYENHRYGNIYVVDEPSLTSILAAGQVPVVHVGQIAGIKAVTRFPVRWVTVLLWCKRGSAAQRAHARASTDVDARLAAWDETLADLRGANDVDFAGRIDTDTTAPDTAAAMIHAWVRGVPVPTAAAEDARP